MEDINRMTEGNTKGYNATSPKPQGTPIDLQDFLSGPAGRPDSFDPTMMFMQGFGGSSHSRNAYNNFRRNRFPGSPIPERQDFRQGFNGNHSFLPGHTSRDFYDESLFGFNDLFGPSQSSMSLVHSPRKRPIIPQSNAFDLHHGKQSEYMNGVGNPLAGLNEVAVYLAMLLGAGGASASGCGCGHTNRDRFMAKGGMGHGVPNAHKAILPGPNDIERPGRKMNLGNAFLPFDDGFGMNGMDGMDMSMGGLGGPFAHAMYSDSLRAAANMPNAHKSSSCSVAEMDAEDEEVGLDEDESVLHDNTQPSSSPEVGKIDPGPSVDKTQESGQSEN